MSVTQDLSGKNQAAVPDLMEPYAIKRMASGLVTCWGSRAGLGEGQWWLGKREEGGESTFRHPGKASLGLLKLTPGERRRSCQTKREGDSRQRGKYMKSLAQRSNLMPRIGRNPGGLESGERAHSRRQAEVDRGWTCSASSRSLC